MDDFKSGTVVFLKVFWRSIFMIIWPILICPVFLFFNGDEYLCLYTILFMVGYIITECIPLGLTAFIPLVFFPLMGLVSTDFSTICYLSSIVMIYIAPQMVAMAIDTNGLALRISLNLLQVFGQNIRIVHLILVLFTMVLSMLIINTAAYALVLPVMETYLRELETYGMGEMFYYPPDVNELTSEEKKELVRPSKITTAFYFSLAYAATIGGCASMTATPTNMVFREMYMTFFAGEISTPKFFIFNIIPVLVSTLLMYFVLEFIFMGLFRSNSPESEKIRATQDNIKKEEIKERLNSLGSFNYKEIVVAVGILLLIILLAFRPRVHNNVPGWAAAFQNEDWINDVPAAFLIAFIFFLLPTDANCLLIFEDDESLHPKKRSPAFLNFKYLHEKVHWGKAMLMGSGVLLIRGITCSNLNKNIQDFIQSMAKDGSDTKGQFMMMIVVSFLTEISPNSEIAKVVFPMVAQVSINLNKHPLILMVPACMMCSASFMLPSGTLTTATAQASSNLPVYHIVWIGFIVKIIVFFVWLIITIMIGAAVFETSGTTPTWVAVGNATVLPKCSA